MNYPTYAREYLTGIADMLDEKNAAYGDSVTDPIRLFAPEADNDLAIRVRLDDKVNRIVKGKAIGEDVIADMIGYLVALQYVRSRETIDAEVQKPIDEWALPEGWEWRGHGTREWYAVRPDMTKGCLGGAVFSHGIGEDAERHWPNEAALVFSIVRRRNGDDS